MTRYQISDHALQRWHERHCGDIFTSLANAVSFGAQRGESGYLRNDDAVFVVRGTHVITVLTAMQAIANMQQQGIQFSAMELEPKSIRVKPVETRLHVAKKKQSKARQRDPYQHAIDRFTDELRKADDDELQAMVLRCPQGSFVGHYAKLKKRLAQQIKLTEQESRERSAVLRYVKETFGDEAWRQACDATLAVRSAMNEPQPTP